MRPSDTCHGPVPTSRNFQSPPPWCAIPFLCPVNAYGPYRPDLDGLSPIADAAVILRAGRPLDFSLVRDLSRKHGLDVTLGILLAQVNARWPGTVPSQLSGLVDTVPRIFLALANWALQVPYKDPPRREESLLFDIIEFHRREPAGGWAQPTASVAFEVIGRRIVRTQNAIRRRLGMSPLPDRTSSLKSLPLCGAAHREVIRHLPQCVGNQPEKRWENLVGEEIHEAADRIVALMPEDSHQCSQLWAMH